MVHELEMPDAFARGGFQGDEAVGEQVGAFSFAPVEIIDRRSGGGEEDTPFFVEGKAAPHIGPPDMFPAFRVVPGVVAILTRVGDRVEYPFPFTAAHIVGPDMAGCGGRAFVQARAQDE